MRLRETRKLFDRELSFPVTCEQVGAEVGHVEPEPPNGDPEALADVLDRCEVDEFRSADELYDAVVSLVGDQYVGRKFYDDRGAAPDDEAVSF